MTSSKSLLKNQRDQTLLVLGPLPPPVGGGTRTVQVFLDAFAAYASLRVIPINSASRRHYRAQKQGFNVEAWQRSRTILKHYLRHIGQADAVLVFASNSFIQTLLPLPLLLTKLLGKPIYLKPFGGDLASFVNQRPTAIKLLLQRHLQLLNGIFVQTQQGLEQLQALGCARSYYLPGCRPARADLRSGAVVSQCKDKFRLVFLSQIRREKGIFVLLEALRQLGTGGDNLQPAIQCDFYGPLHPAVAAEFQQQIELTPGVRYGGLVDAEDVVPLLATYDALVLPTFYPGEGHPGVIIEAMQAGLPIISTDHRAISELVHDQENGLLVPVMDHCGLAMAIKTLAQDSALCQRLAQASLNASTAYSAETIVARALNIMFA